LYKLLEPFQFLSQQECDEIIQYARHNEINEATLHLGHSNKSLRNNRVVWYMDSRRYQQWTDFFRKNFEPNIRWIQTPQIALYAPGEYYDLHQDEGDSSPRTDVRYLTLTANLQPADGAGLEIEGEKFLTTGHGTAVVFPSKMQHRALSPSSGERISFTIWAMGPNTNRVLPKH
jgi:hypothetical protein